MDADCSSERESVILKYVQKHPGSTNEQVIKGLDGTFSRVTVFNTLKLLKERQMILIKKDKPNSQIHYLFVNDENLVVKHMRELDNFANVFIQFLIKIKEVNVKAVASIDQELESKWKLKKQVTSEERMEVEKNPGFFELIKNVDKYPMMFSEPIRIFREIEQAYTLRALFKWPHEIKDRNVLDRLLNLYSEKLRLIKLKMISIILESPWFQPSKYDREELAKRGGLLWTKEIILSLPKDFELVLDIPKKLSKSIGDDWHDFDTAREFFRGLGLIEVEPVIKSLLEITHDLQSTFYKGDKAESSTESFSTERESGNILDQVNEIMKTDDKTLNQK